MSFPINNMSSSPASGPVVGVGGNQQAPTASTIVVADDIEDWYAFAIDGISWRKGLSNAKFCLKTEPFTIGGHTWFIRFFPEGDGDPGWMSIYLTLAHTHDAEVKVHLRFSFLDHAEGQLVLPHICEGDFMFSYFGDEQGFPLFIERKAMEESPHLVDDCFLVRCDVTVKNQVSTRPSAQLVSVPPSDMHRHFGDLLTSHQGFDVVFEVHGETVGAHRIVLASRSTVFKAALFGAMKEKNMSRIRIDDMEASVFKAMLHFVYNDELPEVDKDDLPSMAQHLLVAADRYGLERLKLICEDKLLYHIRTSTLATTLALAEQHGCHGLKAACFEFLKFPGNLEAVMASDGYEYLETSFPSFLTEVTELLGKLAL